MLNNADIILLFIINYPKYGCKYTKKMGNNEYLCK